MTLVTPRLLIIDDDPSTIRLISAILAGQAELLFATSGARALPLAEKERPDLILLDAEMPVMDGFTVCAALKANPITEPSAVIFVTAHSDIDYETRALELGAVDFITKPISPPILRARVKTHLALKFQTDAILRANLHLEEWVAERTAELEDANRELLKARDTALAAARAKTNFMAMMSHELRTPMNGIIGMTEMAINTESIDIRNKCTRMAHNAAQSLHVIIDDIFDYSLLDNDNLKLHIDTFSTKGIIEESLSLLKPQADNKNLEFTFEIQGNIPPFIIGDATRIRQIIFNVVGNAVKFTDNGSVDIVVSYQQNALASELRLIVTDTGIGIPEEARSKVFENFTQADASFSRNFGGAGLGLAISRKLCKLMGGSIELDSAAGTGSTFRIMIPCPPSGEN